MIFFVRLDFSTKSCLQFFAFIALIQLSMNRYITSLFSIKVKCFGFFRGELRYEASFLAKMSEIAVFLVSRAQKNRYSAVNLGAKTVLATQACR